MEMKCRPYIWIWGALIGLPAYPYGRGLMSWCTAAAAMVVIAISIRVVLQQYDKRAARRVGGSSGGFVLR